MIKATQSKVFTKALETGLEGRRCGEANSRASSRSMYFRFGGEVGGEGSGEGGGWSFELVAVLVDEGYIEELSVSKLKLGMNDFSVDCFPRFSIVSFGVSCSFPGSFLASSLAFLKIRLKKSIKQATEA